MKTLIDWLFSDMKIWLFGDENPCRLYRVLCIWTENDATYIQVFDEYRRTPDDAIHIAKCHAWLAGLDVKNCVFEI